MKARALVKEFRERVAADKARNNDTQPTPTPTPTPTPRPDPKNGHQNG